jgi:hypothetical protein
MAGSELDAIRSVGIADYSESEEGERSEGFSALIREPNKSEDAR